MQARVPLSIVFAAEGRRHAIPHRTFTVSIPVEALTPAADTSGDHGDAAAAEGLAFFRYLDSDDTRMPSHPCLGAYAHPAEEYETYVGEDVWDTPDTAHTGSSPADGERDEDVSVAPVPSFSRVVEWVNAVFDEAADWATDGVVLCGRYVVADDAAWVVPSRSPTLFSTREVFLLMRNSSKFLHDVHAQMCEARTQAAARRCGGADCCGRVTLEFTLAQSLAGSGASEMRAMVPYPLHRCPQTGAWRVCDTAASLSFTGVGQRVTDACFPSLMAWSEAEHDANFRLMQRRVEQAALLERTCAADPDFVPRLVASFEKRQRRLASDSSASGATTSPPTAAEPEAAAPDQPARDAASASPLVLLLAVDLLFDSPSLPIYVLSAKARVFDVAPRASVPWTAITESATPWCLWTPLLHSDAAAEGAGVAEAEGRDEEEEEEEDGEAATALDFFRMFRGVDHWNQYVAAMVNRLREGGCGAAGDINKPSRCVQHYCVIATESADLVTCADTVTKRGLPLELMHPELLAGNEEAAAFLKMLRDGLFKPPSGHS